MAIELEKVDRYSFPMGVLDVVLLPDQRTVFAACMDGIYRLDLPEISALPEVPAKAVASEDKSQVDDKSKAEEKKKTPDKPKANLLAKPFRIGGHASYVSSVAWASKSSTLISTALDGSLHFRKLAADWFKTKASDSKDAQPTAGESQATDSDTLVQDVAPDFAARVHSFWSWDMVLSPDERWIVSVTGQYLAGSNEYDPAASEEPTVKVFRADSGELVHSLEMLPSVQCVAIDPSSRYVAAGNLMGDLAVWELETGKQLAAWRTKSFTSWGIIKSHCNIGGIFDVAFSPDGDALYACGMGDMRDPMAGNGKQLWQRFAWRKDPPEKTGETVPEQSGEGLMEVLAWHPSGKEFLMAGRLRGGNWNLGMFSAESGELVGQAKTGMRITSAKYLDDGDLVVLAGMQGQPGLKEGKFPDFGYLERYRVKR